MQDTSNKRIAKNTLMLYIRMLISMLVGLYTSRVVLQTLGVEDYGIYGVVGGFVSMFSLISSSLQGAVSRFLVYELGKKDYDRLRSVFSTSIFIMIGLALLVFLLTETVGLWYLNTKMVIPADRLNAGFWCFQFSIASFLLSLISTPFSAIIIAHERMDIYAYMSIVDVVLKLLICYAVMVSPIDRLVSYSILLFLISIIDQIVYWTFCRRHFGECILQFVSDNQLVREMFCFAGWSFVGSSASILRFQGTNLLLNAFGGPVVNAAYGISNTVCSVANSFVGGFTQAFNPQITKRYASQEYISLMQLLIRGAKFSYFLLYLVSLPLFLNTNFIVQQWLGEVPDHCVTFIRLVLLYLLVETLSCPLITVKSATGRIRNYQLVVGGIILFVLPFSYLCLKVGMEVECVAVVNIGVSIIAFFARMFMLRKDFPCWSTKDYLNKVFCNVIIVSIIAAIIPSLSYMFLAKNWLNLLFTTIISILCWSVSVFYIGCDAAERSFIIQKFRPIITVKKNCSE